MYAGTIFEYDDQSQIAQLPIRAVSYNPLFLALITSDKGPEEWTELEGSEWYEYYGNNISFDKHGQPLLQASIAINAGARLLTKRLVADDATLANFTIVAKVEKVQVQAKNSSGALIYIDSEGNDTIEETNIPKMINQAKISYTGRVVENITITNDPEGILDTIIESLGTDEFAIYTITDNGRGVSNKRIKIIPNYRISKGRGYIEYFMEVTEGINRLESINFSPITNMVVNGRDHSLSSQTNTYSKQIIAAQSNDQLDAFIAKIAEYSDKTVDEIEEIDYLLGFNNKGLPVDYITVDTTSAGTINIGSSYGQALAGGSNGSFGDYPIKKPELFGSLSEVALGADPLNVFDTEIYNQDKWFIELAIDANYPMKTKNAIEKLVMYREDFMFLRDMGTDIRNIDMIEDWVRNSMNNNKFIANYSTSYDIIDPYSKKQITVTIGMALSELMIEHLNKNRNAAVAGIRYSMIVNDAIKGTVNFRPVICPDPLGNQKETMEDLRVNYATYIQDDLVIETEYTSQDELTQFSYINNMLATQDLIRAIRRRCPITRYAFLDGKDLDIYLNDVNAVIDTKRSNFKTVSFEYKNDPVYVNNKIFYAGITVSFRDFAQTEWFKVTAINVDNGEASY